MRKARSYLVKISWRLACNPPQDSTGFRECCPAAAESVVLRRMLAGVEGCERPNEGRWQEIRVILEICVTPQQMLGFGLFVSRVHQIESSDDAIARKYIPCALVSGMSIPKANAI